MADEDVLIRLLVSMPHHTGWTPWLDSRGFPEQEDHPYVVDKGWEALVMELQRSPIGLYLDFWRIDPSGRFYCLRGLEDDFPRPGKPEPLTAIDFFLQVSRIAEIISVALSFARSMGCDEKNTTLAFAFRWSGLCDRDLACWAQPDRSFFPRGKSHQDRILTQTVVPLETPPSNLATYVEQVVAPLFVLFGGMRFHSSVIGKTSTR